MTRDEKFLLVEFLVGSIVDDRPLREQHAIALRRLVAKKLVQLKRTTMSVNCRRTRIVLTDKGTKIAIAFMMRNEVSRYQRSTRQEHKNNPSNIYRLKDIYGKQT